MTLALIDADTIYYRAAFKKNKVEIRKAINETMASIKNALIDFEDYNQMVAVKGRGNYRKDLYPKYKANRKVDDDLKQYLTYGHEYMVEKYEAVMADGMEADDLVSIWAYEARDAEVSYCVVGIDKDLLQIPGNHYNFHKQTHEFIDDDTANLKLMLQCLTGDTSDNIPGIKGIGPKKADKILSGIPMARRWSRVRAAWRGHGAGNPELSRSLLTMLTSWEDYDAIKAQISGETPVSQQDDGKEQNVQDS